MKKLFLILILTGCCFATSNAQVEKFFSFEVNANTKHFFSKFSTDRGLSLLAADKSNYEVSFLPAYNIGRFKFSIGLSYSYSNYYDVTQGYYNRSGTIDNYQ
ncbi:MAG: hypothetical protein LBM25_02110, partial [Bacteroidales bacterium]|nr:hypothetical protein [Bacteroidales bacterium]